MKVFRPTLVYAIDTAFAAAVAEAPARIDVWNFGHMINVNN